MLSRLVKFISIVSVTAFSNLPSVGKTSSNTITPICPVMFDIDSLDILNKLVEFEICNKPVGHIVVQQLSGILPDLDAVSHTVLDLNRKIIHNIIEDPNLSNKNKKELILFTIKLVQDGDNVGSHILKLYFDIVNHCL